MAQDNHNNNQSATPATSSESMIPGKKSNVDDVPKGSSHLAVVGAIDKGKGLLKTEGEDGGGRSEGKISTPHVVAAARDCRSGGRRGDILHIATERERRKRMSEMFTNLHGLLPALPDKADKSSIVMEAVHYIKSLEATLSNLENRKREMQLGREKVGTAANGGVSSLVAAQAPTALVAHEPGVLPCVETWPTGVAPMPPGTMGVVTASPTPVGLQTWSGPNVALSMLGNDAYINVCVARRSGVLTMVIDVLEKHNIEVVTFEISSDNDRSMFTIHARINGASNQFGDNVPSEEIYKLAVSDIMDWLSK